MNEENIVEIWSLFKEYLEKKQVAVVAEKFVDLLAEYGVSDETFKECLSLETDVYLDAAIRYYFDVEDEDETDSEWDS